jgi:hypothetical protein
MSENQNLREIQNLQEEIERKEKAHQKDIEALDRKN